MGDTIAIALTAAELEQAAFVGAKRQTQNLMLGRGDKHGAPRACGWQVHIEGAAGEMAVAKWAGRYWCGHIGNLGADDVGRVQVRTCWRHTGRLIVHPEDRDDRGFILVTGLAPNFVLRGWLWGCEAKQPRYWNDPAGGRAAYFVPQSDLRAMRLPASNVVLLRRPAA